MNGPQTLKRLLTCFWSMFGDRRLNGVGYPESDKLQALKRLAETVVPYRRQKGLVGRRKQFDEVKRKLHPWRRFGSCFVCGQPASERHHIVQLQNGGINSKKNVVSLCGACHAKIHPWLILNFNAT